MEKKLFLLDGMALVYRAHFAFLARPIFTSKGVNSSALYGFTQTLLDILNSQQPTHIAVAFDTEAPTQRHTEFADYKANREAMPEDLIAALPHVRRMLEAFRIPVLTCDGYEADDLIATLVGRASQEGFTTFMVTPDKDFGQLVTDTTFIYKPGRLGDPPEILGPKEVCARWGIERPDQVIDILALMGDSTDNVPGVPSIGEKTASKLIAKFGSVDNLLARLDELTGKTRETLQTHRDLALLSHRLVTLNRNVPCSLPLDALRLQPRDDDQLKALFVEFEFNSLGRRVFGETFKAGRGFKPEPAAPNQEPGAAPSPAPVLRTAELDLFSAPSAAAAVPPPSANLPPSTHTAPQYTVLSTPIEVARLPDLLARASSLGVSLLATSTDPRQARLLGAALAVEPRRAFYVPISTDPSNGAVGPASVLALLQDERIEKVGHDLKHACALLKWLGLPVRGNLFDVMVAHSLVEPDMRHSLDYLAEVYLGRTPTKPPSPSQPDVDPLASLPPDQAAQLACERADLAMSLRPVLQPLLREKAQERVFFSIESPLIPVLVDMQFEGIRVDATTLAEFSAQLGREIDALEQAIWRLAGSTFNLNSPRQLGQVLFEVLKIADAPKKTKTGQYSTDEQTLAELAPDHEIVRLLLEHRTATKLKSTYADALPTTIWPPTGRIHTTYNQVMTATGRLSSLNPNLQNIPIRTERGQEIRKAFVPRSPEYVLLSADYSQIELRIIAALSQEAGLLEAFLSNTDVHSATAARVFGVGLDQVSPEMRRKAKMVNYGIAYGISAFGLAQRLGIPRKEAATIIDQYFQQFPGIAKYMQDTIAFAREHGFVQTVSGRRRYIRDIRSSNNTVRASAERNAINAPIQGTAADMIKLAMVNIHSELRQRGLRTRMLLQVHDELVFDLFIPEREAILPLVEHHMKTALPLDVPMVVDMGTGHNWLEAH